MFMAEDDAIQFMIGPKKASLLIAKVGLRFAATEALSLTHALPK
jgi:hypothetical protein